MRKQFLVASLLLGLLLLAAFVVFLINQTAQLVALAARVDPALGTAVFWGLLLLYAGCGLVPLLLLLRLPRPLTPPEREDSPDFPRHLQALTRRLRGNPLLAGRPVGTRAELAEAITILGARASQFVRAAASEVFVATAVSQNGSLDALIVLVMQTRLIWRVAHVYYQRPGLRDLVWLYGNVAGTALVTSQLDDLDLTEQVQPIVANVLGSVAGAIPGLQAATALVVNSIVAGTANAFLTLRVGLIARSYCGAVVVPERRSLRRQAVSQAAQMLGIIARDCARRVAIAFVTASRARTTDAAREVGSYVRRAGMALVEQMRRMKAEKGN